MIKENVFLFPLGNKIAVKRSETKDVSDGGIILPDQVKDKKKPANGRVVAVGKGYKDNKTGDWFPMEVKIGDFVIFNQFQQMEFEVGDEKYLVMSEEDILGIIKPAKAEYDDKGSFVRFIES